MLRALVPHPDTPCTALERVEAELGADARGALRLRYTMTGDADGVIVAAAAPGTQPQRRDGLWRRTCCEVFVRDAEGPGYREYNFAPSGDWAAYAFTDYRAGGVALETTAPEIELDRSPRRLALTVRLGDLALDALDGRPINLACIVETRACLCYWALAHAPGRPDFHHAASFALMPSLARAASVDAWS